jgi:hypothetical protein
MRVGESPESRIVWPGIQAAHRQPVGSARRTLIQGELQSEMNVPSISIASMPRYLAESYVSMIGGQSGATPPEPNEQSDEVEYLLRVRRSTRYLESRGGR